jgi:hypothetical protein
VAALLSGLLPKVPLPAQTAKKPVFLHAEIAGKTAIKGVAGTGRSSHHHLLRHFEENGEVRHESA